MKIRVILPIILSLFFTPIFGDLCPPAQSLAPTCTCLTLAEGLGASCKAIRDVADLLPLLRLITAPITELSLSDSPQMKNFGLEALEEVPNLKDLQSLMLFRVIINFPVIPRSLNFPKLRIMNISKNGIRDFPPTILSNLTELTYLNLSHNALTTVVPSHFEGLRKLETLDLTNNKLNYLPPLSFQGLPKLKTLKMVSEITFKKVNYSMFITVVFREEMRFGISLLTCSRD